MRQWQFQKGIGLSLKMRIFRKNQLVTGNLSLREFLTANNGNFSFDLFVSDPDTQYPALLAFESQPSTNNNWTFFMHIFLCWRSIIKTVGTLTSNQIFTAILIRIW